MGSLLVVKQWDGQECNGYTVRRAAGYMVNNEVSQELNNGARGLQVKG